MAISDVYCNVAMNFDEGNISNKTFFTLTFMIICFLLEVSLKVLTKLFLFMQKTVKNHLADPLRAWFFSVDVNGYFTYLVKYFVNCITA